jgi:hypothetical protein
MPQIFSPSKKKKNPVLENRDFLKKRILIILTITGLKQYRNV